MTASTAGTPYQIEHEWRSAVDTIAVASSDEEKALPAWLGCPPTDGSTSEQQPVVASPWSRWIASTTRMSSAWVVATLEDAIRIGVIDGRLWLDPTFRGDLTLGRLLDARVFNDHGEIHLWRGADGRLAARGRVDGEGPVGQMVEESWWLWGTRAAPHDRGAWTTLTEDRGTTLCLPVLIGDDRVELPMRLHVRHYLERDDLRMPEFRDTRFVGFARRNDKHPQLIAPAAPALSLQGER